jgi:hypothetical protein
MNPSRSRMRQVRLTQPFSDCARDCLFGIDVPLHDEFFGAFRRFGSQVGNSFFFARNGLLAYETLSFKEFRPILDCFDPSRAV